MTVLSSQQFPVEPWQTTNPPPFAERKLNPEAIAQRQSAREWIAKNVESSVEPSEHEGSYVMSSSGINSAIRHKDAPPEFMKQIAPVIEGIDKSVAGSHVKVNTTAFRGQPKSILAGRKVGDVYSDEGFGSTSLLHRTAASYAGHEGETVEVRIPKGTEASAPTMEVNRRMTEGRREGNADQEILLGRNRQYRVERLGPHPRVSVVPRYTQGKLF